MANKGYRIIFIASLLFLFSCNKQAPKQSQQQQTMREQAQQQAKQDSIARAQAKEEAQLAAQRESERMSGRNDTTASTSGAAANSKPSVSGMNQEIPSGTFTSSGDYALQVSSWRSQWKARKELETWKNRGYDHAYLMKYGNEKTGNVWFRVRLGHLQTRSGGKQIGKEIANKYDIKFWVAYVG